MSLRLLFCLLTLLFVQAETFAEESDTNKSYTTIMIPMRDGTELPTDIYLPNAEAKNLPCILLRGPGGRHAATAVCFASFAKEGYVVAIQDTRAAADGHGKTLPYYSDGWGEQQDGYDTVQWLAQSSLTNGKIGTLGCSNMGITQLMMAPTAPPSLCSQYITVAAPSLYDHAICPGGRLLKNLVEGWLGHVARDPAVLEFVLSNLDKPLFWESFNVLKKPHDVHVPAVHQGGWFDIFVQGTIDSYCSWQQQGGEGAKGKQKLIIGPWVHSWPATNKLGDFTVPAEAQKIPYGLGPKIWFDYYLKGIQNHLEEIPSVIYYVMGPFDGSPSSGNVWRTSDSWPIPHQEISYYFTHDKRIVSECVPKKTAVLSYKHDPINPLPTIGGRNLFLEAGPKDQRSMELRDDLLIFTSEPLSEDIEVTGKIIAKLFVNSAADEADVVVRLSDVYPDGRSVLIADALTCSRLDSFQEDKIREVQVDLWSTSIVFAKGHRLRVSIAGSNFPRFEVANSKEKGKTHMHHLHVGGKSLSQIILPVVRKGSKWLVSPQPLAERDSQ